uniref:Uncharacterized protein n=1 Tax=Oryza nivara TaxID=4536 RepID=A0A679BDF2_ORYNI|nr:hypothetical protein [Oryza sativa f. spontanea]BBF89859.1 hypothetical protein [Oryza sativa f. spontanea]
MARHHHTPHRQLLDELLSSNEGNRLQIGSVKTEEFKVPRVRMLLRVLRNYKATTVQDRSSGSGLRKTACLGSQYSTGGNQLQILGTGSVQTERFKVPGVRYVQEGQRNTISVAQLAGLGLVTVFEPIFCHVKDEETGDIIGRGRSRNGLYVLDYLRIHQTKEKEQEDEDVVMVVVESTTMSEALEDVAMIYVEGI